MKVKICGVRDAETALIAANAGADLLGFVFAPSRRRVSPALAREIVAAVRARHAGRVRMAGVFVDECPLLVDALAETCDLDYVQLCGHEDAAYLDRLDTPVILARQTGPGLLADVRAVSHARVAAILLDAVSQTARGGTGTLCDWTVAARIARERPVILAGGLAADNVAAAVAAVRPWGVDVSSGVESDGRKSPAKIVTFVARAKAAAAVCHL